ncbi:MAG TPA: hypothetical protein VN958_12505 [Chitinophagaceae bacterium]|nr:hypothetical protein [Chitinophagaceae bacterium]
MLAYEGYNRIIEIDSKGATKYFSVNPILWLDQPDYKISFSPLDVSNNIIRKCLSNSLSLKECAEFSLGLTPYDKYRGHTQEQIKNKISKILNRYIPAIVEYHIFNNEEFHDRYLITNNACIFSGYGIDIIKNERVKKDSTWIAFRPFKRVNVNGDNDVFFYNVMQKKLAMMKKWVEKSTNKISSNPLFKL